MTSPPGVSQPTHPGSPGQGPAWMMATVQSVDPAKNIAVVVDQLTKTFNMPLNAMRAKGMPPEVGEQWVITREYGGAWAFAMLLNGSPTGEPIPQANVTGLPVQIAKIDPAIARLAAVEAKINYLESLSNMSERWGFGDLMSSQSRYESRDPVHFDGFANTIYALLGPAPRGGITVTWLTACVTTVGTQPCFVGLYLGDTVTSMTRVANGSFPTTQLNVRSAVLGSPVVIPEGKLVALAFTSSDFGFTLAAAAFGPAPGLLTSKMGWRMQAYNNATSLPSSIDMSDTGGFTSTSARLWCALQNP